MLFEVAFAHWREQLLFKSKIFKSVFSKAPSRGDFGGKPTDFTKGSGGEYGKYTGETPETLSNEDNVDVKPKKVSHADHAEGKMVGTGKNTPAGAIGKTAPLSKAPKKM